LPRIVAPRENLPAAGPYEEGMTHLTRRAARRLLLPCLAFCFGACASGGPASRRPDYEQRNRPVTREDLLILERADALLGDETKWNRHDTRDCPPQAAQLSLFCALQAASIEVLGSYDHRRTALQEVRFAIEDFTHGREFEHRMMDFNNLPETGFGDVKQVLATARQRVAARLAGRPAP
jgi:hypothetical protein